MEQAQQYYWRRELMVKSHFMNNIIDRNHSSSSWEERAFAEDHHGGVRGCIWPPRSYSCSFCRREFRSAQALGGHMNVHRKDRARLKQSSSSSSPPHHQPNDVCHPTHDDRQNLKSLDYHDHHHHHHAHYPNSSSSIVLASTPPSRVSVFSTNESSIHHSFLKQQKGFDVSSISRAEVVENPREEASAIFNLFGADLVMELNPEVLSSKRAKTDVFTLSILSKPCSNDRWGLQSEVLGLNSSSLEDIDLELRLGQPPKVN